MAVEIFKLFGSIFVNNDEANKSISETEKKSKGVASTLGNGIKTAAKWGTAMVGGAVAGVGALSSVAESTREYRTEMGKLDTAFTTNKFSAADAKQTYSDLYAVVGDSGQATEAANHLSLLCNSTKDLQSWTEICTGVYGQFGDSLPIEGLTEAANETAKVGQVTGPLADALNWMGVSEDAFNEKLAKCSSEQERQQLITSTLTSLYSDASAQYKETNGDVMESNRAHQQLSDTMAQIGAVAEPVLNSIIGLGGKLLEQLSPLIESVAEKLAPVLINICEEVAPIIVSMLEQIMPLIEELLPFIAQLMEQLAPIIVQLVEALLPVLVQVIKQLLPPFMEILNALMPLLDTIFQLVQPFIDLILQLIEPFAALISTAIAPLIVKLAELLNNLLQPLIPVFNEIAGILSETLQPVFEALAPVFDLLTDALSPLFELLSMLLNAILPALTPVIKILADVFSNVLGLAIKGISGAIESLTGIFNGLIDFIDGVFSGNWDKAWNGILEIFKNVLNLIPNAVEFIINGAIGMINGLFDGINWAIEWAGLEIPHIPEVTLPRFRAGIDYVPNDKYLAYLDAGEAVLTAQEAEQYRKAKQDGTNPFRSDNTDKPSTTNIDINVNISGVTVNSDSDIDSLAERLSERLAAEITSKRKVFS
ncbi:phage tail protein [Ruminococcus sp.]|uniref:phage tail protein n=1 Tax=Ruminococcus sp. TaxID=41978 RepID=UPI00206AF1DA|nr:MAG TPA: minor tail protein [Caudoviricetes sp.]